MDGQSARLLAERVVILLFLVAFIDSIGRFLYVGYNEQYNNRPCVTCCLGLIDLG